MARPAVHASDKARRLAQGERRKLARAVHNVNFTGVDGEGMGNGHNHRYVLLGVGQEQIANPKGLSYEEIFQFLYEQFQQDKKSAYVGFFLGYDFNQWLKGLPENRARMLLLPEGKLKRARINSGNNNTPFPVKVHDWEMDILSMKRFKLRPIGEKSWLYVCDAGPFFQSSFLSVIDPSKWTEPVVTEQEYATIKEGKESRSTAVLDADMRKYNALENDVLSRVMVRLNRGFTSIGVRLKNNQWFGPGQAAQEWLKGTEAPRTETINLVVPKDIRDVARWTYYGGWFELFAHGHIPGISWEYDINSAYPYVASRLPCLLHGTWNYGRGVPAANTDTANGGLLRIVHARVSGTDRHIGAMLHRLPDGRIARPQNTAGYYWQAELDAAVRAGIIDKITYIEWWEYEPCNCRPPLRGLVGLYDHRLRVGKNTPEGKSDKFVYNSVYGKFAQSVGKPKFASGIYASLITSGCRTMILDAIATHPDKTDAVVMIATDAVYFTSSHPGLTISEKIGEWSAEKHSKITLFKPGVYWGDKARDAIKRGTAPTFKARGISAKAFAGSLSSVDSHFDRWKAVYPDERDPDGDREGWFPSVDFKSGFSMVTCTQALRRGKWFLAGAVGNCTLTQDSDPNSKRHSGWYENGIYWSSPYVTCGWEKESTLYDKRFGQPVDPEEWGITPDGYVIETIGEVFK